MGTTFYKYRHRIGLLYFTAGVFVGFQLSFLSSVMDLKTNSPIENSLQAQDAARSSAMTKDDGWSTVHVFYGNTSHIADTSTIPVDYFNKVKWFSQARQDEVVSALLRGKRNGYFVDLAANDAVRISNTYALETHFGWSGLCLEPNPMYWAGLSYRKCNVVGAVVGASNMEEVHFKYPNRAGPKGGIVGANFDIKEESKFDEDHLRFTISLLDVFRRFDTPKVIDYLSLDVEGSEDYIMASFPFSQYRCNILTIERPSNALKSLLESNGYIFLKLLKSNSGETLWVHSSFSNDMNRKALEIETDRYKYRDRGMDNYLQRDSPRLSN